MNRKRRRGGLPQIRRLAGNRTAFSASRKTNRSAQTRGAYLPQIGRTRQRRQGPGTALTLILMGVIAALVLILTNRTWLPLLSEIIPDRYIMAYAPEAVQESVFEIDINAQVPTPIVDTGITADDLLGEAPVITMTPSPSPQPTPEGGYNPEDFPDGYVQPTLAPIDPTATITPAAVLAVDSRATDRDNSADLSDVEVLLTGFSFEQQGYNNCGPASLRVNMSYWGAEFTEDEAAAFLKPNPEDPNVRPDEMARYAAQYGYQTLVRANGNMDLLKQFLLAGYPVMIETGYDPEPTTVGWTSHYLTLVGYTSEGFIAMDTYRRPNWLYSFEELDHYWRQFNRHYLIIHRPDQAVAVASIVGEDMDEHTNWENARDTAQYELSLDREDPYGWYNLGSSLTHLGEYDKAVSAFNEARQLGLPWRWMWYQFEPYTAYMQVGAYDEVIALADSVLQTKASEEAYYFKGLALLAQGDTTGGQRQIELALRFNENYLDAQAMLESLESSG